MLGKKVKSGFETDDYRYPAARREVLVLLVAFDSLPKKIRQKKKVRKIFEMHIRTSLYFLTKGGYEHTKDFILDARKVLELSTKETS